MSTVSRLGTFVSEAPRPQGSTAQIVSRFYDAFLAGDADAAASMIAPDFIGHVPGRGLNAGEYWGVSGFRKFMENIARYNGGVFEMEVPVFSVDGDDAFTREVVRINRAIDPDRIFTLRFVNWLKLRDGSIVEHWVIPEDQHAYDEYWSGRNVETKRIDPTGPPTETKSRNGLDTAGATSDSTRRIVADMYGHFWRGDAEGMRARISADVVVNIVGRSDVSGLYEGWAGYLEFRDKLMAMSGDKYRLDVVALAASARDVWATERIRMNRRWDPQVQELFVQMHFEVENEMIVRIDDFPLDTHEWERFYTRPTA